MTAGQEYIVSYILGFTYENELAFKYLTLDEPVSNRPFEEISRVELFLDKFDDPVKPKFFELERAKHLEVGQHSLESFIKAMENDFISGDEYLVELIDDDCVNNLYYLELEKYFIYLDIEINKASKTSIDVMERNLNAYKQQAERFNNKPPEYNLNKLYNLFLIRQKQRKNFFEGTKIICETLQQENNAIYYGDIIELFKERRVKSSTVKEFYENLWLAKKEFQVAVLIGYGELFSTSSFEKYKW